MAITSERVEQRGANAIRVFAVSSLGAAAVFYWYWNGALVAWGKLPFHDFTVAPGESGHWWVSDDETAVPPVAYPSRARLEWENAGDAEAYYVLQFVDGEFSLVEKVAAGAHGSQHWVSGVLKDDTLHYFAVDPVSAAGNEGNFKVMTIFMVRPPDPVAAAWSYEPGMGVVTAG